MATLNIKLTLDNADFVASELKSGGFSSSDELVAEAIVLLRLKLANEAAKAAALKQEIDLAIVQATSKDFSSLNVREIADHVL